VAKGIAASAQRDNLDLWVRVSARGALAQDDGDEVVFEFSSTTLVIARLDRAIQYSRDGGA
jgi:hypothetical protein